MLSSSTKRRNYDPDIAGFLEIKVKIILDPSKVPLTTLSDFVIHFLNWPRAPNIEKCPNNHQIAGQAKSTLVSFEISTVPILFQLVYYNILLLILLILNSKLLPSCIFFFIYYIIYNLKYFCSYGCGIYMFIDIS